MLPLFPRPTTLIPEELKQHLRDKLEAQLALNNNILIMGIGDDNINSVHSTLAEPEWKFWCLIAGQDGNDTTMLGTFGRDANGKYFYKTKEH